MRSIVSKRILDSTPAKVKEQIRIKYNMVDLIKLQKTFDSMLVTETIDAFISKVPEHPIGWLDIKEHAPQCLAIDWLDVGYSLVMVRDSRNNEFEVPLGGDTLLWLYETAEPLNLTHWHSPIQTTL